MAEIEFPPADTICGNCTRTFGEHCQHGGGDCGAFMPAIETTAEPVIPTASLKEPNE